MAELIIGEGQSEVYYYQFDGVDEKITMSSLASVDFSGRFTFSFWARLTGTPANGDIVMGQGSGAAGTWAVRLAQVNVGNDEARFALYNNNTLIMQTTLLTPVLDTVINVLYTRNNTDNVRIYVNGVLDAGPNIKTDDLTSTTEFRLGGGATGYAPMDLWSPMLSAWNFNETEALELYNLGRGGDLSGHSQYGNMRNWWPADEAVAPTAFDQIGSDDGTFVNMDSGNIVQDVI